MYLPKAEKSIPDAETSSDLMIEKTYGLLNGELSTWCYESSEILPFGPAPLHLNGAGLKSLRSLPPYG
jgi:hypothetical protein